MQSADENKQDQEEENMETTEEVPSLPQQAVSSESAEGAAVPEDQETGSNTTLPSSSSLVKPPPSFVQAAVPVDAAGLRDAILGDGASASAYASATASKKKKKKKKRPKSAQTSPDAVSSTSTTSGADFGVEPVLTASLEAMTVSDTAAATPAAEAEQKKKKNKKKKKGDCDQNTADAGPMEVEMTEKGEKQGEGGGQKTEQPQGPNQAQSNLQLLAQNLLDRQKVPRKPLLPQQQMQKQQMQQQQQGQGQRQGQGQWQNQQQQKQKGNKKNIFEPHWSMEKVSEGLKRGTLIQGPIRINPRNYEDAYVPLPDGTADIYISGMGDRNRALNGDEVAVLVQDRDNWRVFTEEVDHYEKCNSPKPVRTPAAESEMANTASEKGVEKENDTDVQEKSPDVLVEEEEEVELDSSGKPIESTLVTKQVTGSAATPAQPSSSTPQPSTPLTASGGGGCKGKDKKGGGGEKNQCSPKKRYKSVKEVMDQASPVVRKLFDATGAGGGGPAATGGGGGGEEDGEEGGAAAIINADKFMQRTGKVVAIVERKHSRASSGNLRPMQDKNHNFAVFAPSDSRVPRIMIPTRELPPGFKERPDDFTKILFIARITEWNETSKMPRGMLARSLGEAGQLEPETEALLTENNIDSSEFSEKVLACLPKETPWTIPAKELEWRRDLRRECIFTIDPSTARDLDDALHCTVLGGGVYEVGVHIADVSYFVEEGTELDEVARKRATSVYLVQKVIPMLPRLLCEQLCSLNPDEDRLSFSVIWKITEEGQILEEWFGRTVIRSCVKLSYEHAQGFIMEPDREWTREELPPLSEGFTVEDIKTRVLHMDKIAKALRKARFDGGALRLDQVKLQFTLNRESGLPNGYFVYEQRDSNKLVEEFMLLANMAVAHKIRKCHKNKAVLRRHPPPQSRMVNDLKELCASLGFPIEVNTAKDIQLSLARYTGNDELSQARLQILVAMCSRPMRNAKYFCCGMLADETLYGHYALNVPLYTHFTSPIRRYPDILVHRTLAASLGYCPVTERTPALLQDISLHCNDMKSNAKQCSERSNELYFAIFVKEAGPLEEKGMVMTVLDKSFDVFILRLGVVKRVYCEKLPLEGFTHRKEGKRQDLTLKWKPDDGCPHVVTQKLSVFSLVNCVLHSEPEPLKWSAFIRHPVPGDVSIVM
ncbi:DIS3-like exonuclease 2 [Babylonia areolata]|uniref:DIS3-like exonuclease 2 n=1 Tax=Babylonia areolata TaxID=304850 RepID=UPI003FCF91AD